MMRCCGGGGGRKHLLTININSTTCSAIMTACSAIPTMVLFALLLLLSPVAAACECDAGARTTMLDCSNQGLTALPTGVLRQCPKLRQLDVSDNQLTSLDWTEFPAGEAQLTALETLVLSNNKITRVIGTATQVVLPALTTMDLSYNQLSDMEAAAFQHAVPKLASLDLSNNNLRAVSAAWLQHLPDLEGLSLSANNLTHLNGNPFVHQTRLAQLDLRQNRISVLAAGYFKGLSSLDQLLLSENAIATLPADDVFVGMPVLKGLNLRGNLLHSLNASTFSGSLAASLQELDLSRNRFATTATIVDVLRTLTLLSSIGLAGNRLDAVTAAFIGAMPALTDLSLNSNRITALPANVFASAGPGLRFVDLANNAIPALPENVFRPVRRLTSLRVAGNRITSVPPTVFRGLTHLQGIDLNFNMLTSLHEETFRGLSQLVGLYVNSNRLSALPPTVFQGLPNLKWLFMSNNTFTTIDASLFFNLPALNIILLNHNALTDITGDWLRITNLTTIALHNNNFATVSAPLSALLQHERTQMFSMLHNPSVCVRGLDPDTRAVVLRCDCAEGYFGTSTCTPLSDVVVFRTIFSAQAGIILENKRLQGGEFTADLSNLPSTPEQGPNLFPFNLTLVTSSGGSDTGSDGSDGGNGGVDGDGGSQGPSSATTTTTTTTTAAAVTTSHVTVELPVVLSAFAVQGQVLPDAVDFDAPVPARDVVLDTLAVNQPLPFVDLDVQPNPYIPTNITFAVHGELPAGIANTTRADGWLEGTLLEAGRFDFTIVGTDLFTLESKAVAHVTLAVANCGPSTCLNAGTCVNHNPDTPDDNAFHCQCRSAFAGRFCEKDRAVVSRGVDPARLRDGLIGAAFAAAAVVLLAWWIQRERLKKSYHVFVSYRQATDAPLAERVVRALQACTVDGQPLVVFWDRLSIEVGDNWQLKFLSGVHRSCMFVPIVSNAGVANIERVSVFDSKPDNVLLEYETALSLHRKRRIGIFPLFVQGGGGGGGGGMSSDVGAGMSSDVGSHQVGGGGGGDGGGAMKRGCGAGGGELFNFDYDRFPNGPSKTNKNVPVCETMKQLFAIQGLFVDSERGLSDSDVTTVMSYFTSKVWNGRGHNKQQPRKEQGLGLKRHWHSNASRSRRARGVVGALVTPRNWRRGHGDDGGSAGDGDGSGDAWVGKGVGVDDTVHTTTAPTTTTTTTTLTQPLLADERV
ncbi:hypothetical protein PTSG_06613 [Salpingoeca rosetta]|uniref:EGF-like domain-containing protein n=1 Tax=Salpingoeca rosetta (strain ATCC 50818 / BSB-021) TaxID=946362 RepID=F2UFH5_SALR5|nr:uncharacterized protein PTSG_06613 [Salpingoeca rosetta]EGD75543.1 hypothetical protein PTSG_06613 [Salpingoeca rosetta]|eukprot:XP_004992000.1 hypothetical protein PTSG_06613 [Salpingoeca rosetta]